VDALKALKLLIIHQQQQPTEIPAIITTTITTITIITTTTTTITRQLQPIMAVKFEKDPLFYITTKPVVINGFCI